MSNTLPRYALVSFSDNSIGLRLLGNPELENTYRQADEVNGENPLLIAEGTLPELIKLTRGASFCTADELVDLANAAQQLAREL